MIEELQMLGLERNKLALDERIDPLEQPLKVASLRHGEPTLPPRAATPLDSRVEGLLAAWIMPSHRHSLRITHPMNEVTRTR